jgi:hypothetical protein
MSIQFKEVDDQIEPLILKIKIHAKLTVLDYEMLTLKIEELTKEGVIRIFIELFEFNGWTVGAIWEETKYSGKQFLNVERIAIVGDKYWSRGMATFCKAFPNTEARFYDSSDIKDARQWILEDPKQS